MLVSLSLLQATVCGLRPGSHVSEDRAARWLFGTLTCPHDLLPIDAMLKHQLEQSASFSFDHKVLYLDAGSEQPTEPDADTLARHRRHAAALKRVRHAGLVHEVVDLKKTNFLALSKKVMTDQVADAYVRLNHKQHNNAMVAFLHSCRLDFDHCVWLDSDMFVHRGKVPWVDHVSRRFATDPSLTYALPTLPKDAGPSEFCSRAIVYHSKNIGEFLPLSVLPDDNTFEALISLYMRNRSSEGHKVNADFSLDGGSWVLHPPDSEKDLLTLLANCKIASASSFTSKRTNANNAVDEAATQADALIAIVKEGCGSQPEVASSAWCEGDAAYTSQSEEENSSEASSPCCPSESYDVMQLMYWVPRMRRHCEKHVASR